MTSPTKLAIFAAERKLQEARRDTHDGLCRLRTAVNTRLTRFSTYVCAAGLGALIVFALSHGRRMRRPRADGVTAGSIGGIAAAFLARQAWRELSRLVFGLWVTRNEPRSARLPRREEALHARNHSTQPGSSTRRVVH
jgi:hypothetical protein